MNFDSNLKYLSLEHIWNVKFETTFFDFKNTKIVGETFDSLRYRKFYSFRNPHFCSRNFRICVLIYATTRTYCTRFPVPRETRRVPHSSSNITLFDDNAASVVSSRSRRFQSCEETTWRGLVRLEGTCKLICGSSCADIRFWRHNGIPAFPEWHSCLLLPIRLDINVGLLTREENRGYRGAAFSFVSISFFFSFPLFFFFCILWDDKTATS